MPNREVRSNAEFQERLEVLTSAQLLRLRSQADLLALGLPMTGDDLLHEAVVRTLEGSRNFPAGVDVSTYLKNAMKSIASAEREKVLRYESMGDPEDESSHINRIASRALSPEAMAIQRVELTETLPRLRDRLSGDTEALAMLEYRLEGFTNAEIMEVQSMDTKRFDAARKRLRRAIGRIRGERGEM